MKVKSRHWMSPVTLLALAIVLAAAAPALAATWTVEKDGSGDFTIIQDAIDAAAPGDSIRIGPGRFDTFRPGVSTINRTGFSAIIWVKTAGLSLIGSGRDTTMIGPAVPIEDGDGGKTASLYMDGGSMGSVVEGLHCENTATIVIIRDQIVMQDCRVKRVPIISAAAIAVVGAADVVIRTTEVTGPNGVLTAIGTSGLLVEDCSFDDETLSGIGVIIGNGASECMVRRCTFRRGAGGVQFGLGGTGWVEDCTFEEIAVAGIDVSQGSAVVRRCHFGETRQTLAANIGRLEVYDSLIEGGSQSTLSFWCDVLIRGSHILNAGGLSVRNRATVGELVDLRHNWWGTADTTLIEGWIDDPEGTVLWSPIADTPIPAEPESITGLKDKFHRN